MQEPACFTFEMLRASPSYTSNNILSTQSPSYFFLLAPLKGNTISTYLIKIKLSLLESGSFKKKNH